MHLPLRFSIVLKDMRLYFWWIFSLNQCVGDLYSFNLIIPELEWRNRLQQLQQQKEHQGQPQAEPHSQQPVQLSTLYTVYSSFYQLYEDLPGLYLTMSERPLFEKERVVGTTRLPNSIPSNITQFLNACWFQVDNIVLPLHDKDFYNSQSKNSPRITQPLRFRHIPYLNEKNPTIAPRQLSSNELQRHPFFCAILVCFSTYWVLDNEIPPSCNHQYRILEKGFQSLLKYHLCQFKIQEKDLYALEWASIPIGEGEANDIFTTPTIPLCVLKTLRNMYN